MKANPTYIDLFAGCGGLSLGLHNAAWKGIFAIEKNQDAFSTLEFNLISKLNHFEWPKWLPIVPHDINDIILNYTCELMDIQETLDLVAGGPPCQGFSMAGKRSEKDNRNELVKSYVKFVHLVKPKYIFFENVRGFTVKFKNSQNTFSDYVIDELEKDYDVSYRLIDFSNFGVPQKRLRFILFGIRKDLISKRVKSSKLFFEILKDDHLRFLSRKKLSSSPTLEEALSDLLMSNGIVPSPDSSGFFNGVYGSPYYKYQEVMREDNLVEVPDSHRFANHTDNIRNRFKIAIEKGLNGKSYREYFKVKKAATRLLKKDGISPTLTSLPDDLIHYCEPRILTVREYARIQSFPDWYEFKGRYTTGGKARVREVPRYTQIGNAIPPLFSEQVGLAISKISNLCDVNQQTTV